MFLQGQLQKGGEEAKEPKSSFHSWRRDGIHPRPHRTTISFLPCLTEYSGDVTVTYNTYAIPASLWAPCLVPFGHLSHSVSLDTVGAVLRHLLTHHPPVAASVTENNGDSNVAGSWQSFCPFLTRFICFSLGYSTRSMGPLGQPLILWAEGRLAFLHPLEETRGLTLSHRTSQARSLWGKEEGVSG